MQAELHSTLAGVTAARHEQQEEQRKIAQLKHQHEDTLQVHLLSLFPNLLIQCDYPLGWSCIVVMSSLTKALAHREQCDGQRELPWTALVLKLAAATSHA